MNRHPGREGLRPPTPGGRRGLAADERGISVLEIVGIIGVILVVLTFIPAVRGWIGDAYDAIFKQVDETTGETASFSIAARGLLITVTSIIAFVGTGWLLLYTNVGKRLAFLITGTATFGWMVVGSMLFVVYAPRGIRPTNLEGLNSFQIRIPAIAITLASLVLFIMFVVALDRYEKEDA